MICIYLYVYVYVSIGIYIYIYIHTYSRHCVIRDQKTAETYCFLNNLGDIAPQVLRGSERSPASRSCSGKLQSPQFSAKLPQTSAQETSKILARETTWWGLQGFCTLGPWGVFGLLIHRLPRGRDERGFHRRATNPLHFVIFCFKCVHVATFYKI